MKIWDQKVKKVLYFMNFRKLILRMYELKELIILKLVKEAIKAMIIFKSSKH